jgi:DNA-binding NtrC family response regulator
MKKFTILIADDSEVFREFLAKYIRKIDDRFKVLTASDGLDAFKILQRGNIDLAFLDNIMPEYSGVDLLKSLDELGLFTKVVIVSGYGTISVAVDTIKNGALGFIEKPILNIKIINEYIDRVLPKNILSIKKHKNSQEKNFIGQNRKIIEIKELIKKISYSPSTVFITGESGTGKDIVSQAIHNNSKRSDKAFITVNCSAIPDTLIESELFGYKKGAFTGAISDRKGLFEEADGGTLFLDEIGDMPLFTQAKVLRAIQNREIKPIGSNEIIKVDVRIIAATNKDIKDDIKKGKFRSDLWYRINVFSIDLPPLREREDDIPILIYYFLNKFNKILDKNIKEVDNKVLSVLKRYNWPGNIRELENTIERMAVLETSDSLSVDNLDPYIVSSVHTLTYSNSNLNKEIDYENNYNNITLKEAKKLVSSNFEKQYISSLLKKTNNNITKASVLAGVERSNFRKLMRKYGL